MQESHSRHHGNAHTSETGAMLAPADSDGSLPLRAAGAREGISAEDVRPPLGKGMDEGVGSRMREQPKSGTPYGTACFEIVPDTLVWPGTSSAMPVAVSSALPLKKDPEYLVRLASPEPPDSPEAAHPQTNDPNENSPHDGSPGQLVVHRHERRQTPVFPSTCKMLHWHHLESAHMLVMTPDLLAGD